MMFWLLAGAMAAAATLAVVVPLLRKPSIVASETAYDREVYLARLREIETDVAMGVIGKTEAEAARAEEARRLLSVAEDRQASGQQGSLARSLAVAALIVLPAAAILSYVSLGQPGMEDMALADRKDRDPAEQSIAQLIERAEARLQQQPDDLRGWLVVAPIYMRMGRYEDAARAWRNAMRLEPQNAEYHSSFAEALVAASGGVVTDDARKAFEGALERRPNDPKSLFYLAVALGQQGAYDEAEKAWRNLISTSPQDAPWIPAAKTQLASVLEKAGKPAEPDLAENAPAAGQQGPGPSAADVEAAAGMSADDRQAMIEGMVANLAAKMKDNPSDKDGWLRLIRAYGVLGRLEDGRAAIAEARTHLASDATFISELDGLAKGLGMEEGAQ